MRRRASFVREEFVRGFLDEAGHIDIRRAAIGRIVFEAAFVGRIVRRTNDDPVRQAGFAAAIVGKDRMRNHGRRRISAVRVDHRLDAVGGKDFKSAGESGLGQRMRVHAQEQRPVDASVAAIEAHRLRDRQDVRFIEGGREGGAAMPRCAE